MDLGKNERVERERLNIIILFQVYFISTLYFDRIVT